MTWYQWQKSRAYTLLWNIDVRPTKWIYSEDMTDREKLDNPSYATADGYLKRRDISKAYQEWWDRLSGDEKQCIREIPNFDAKKFERITGINTEIFKILQIKTLRLVLLMKQNITYGACEIVR